MSRIESALDAPRRSGRTGLIPFLMAGDPSLEETAGLVTALARAGAEVVELGVPFSDPVADGPAIQRASERALQQGVDLGRVLETVEVIRAETQVPLLLFGYLNPILAFGPERFADKAAGCGVDGVLIVDLPVDEGEDLRAMLRRSALDTIQLVAPTSGPVRTRLLAAESRGFVYCIARTGVTGTRAELSPDMQATVACLRQTTSLPIAVGFGISRPEHVRVVGSVADAAVVGSALVETIAATLGPPEARTAAAEGFLRSLRGITGEKGFLENIEPP